NVTLVQSFVLPISSFFIEEVFILFIDLFPAVLCQLSEQVGLLVRKLGRRYNTDGNKLVAVSVAMNILDTFFLQTETFARLRASRNREHNLGIDCRHFHLIAEGCLCE